MRRFFSVALLEKVRGHPLASSSSSDGGERLGLFRSAAATPHDENCVAHTVRAGSVDGSSVESVDTGAQAPLYDEPFGGHRLAKGPMVVEHPATARDEDRMRRGRRARRQPAARIFLYLRPRQVGCCELSHPACRTPAISIHCRVAFFERHWPSYTSRGFKLSVQQLGGNLSADIHPSSGVWWLPYASRLKSPTFGNASYTFGSRPCYFICFSTYAARQCTCLKVLTLMPNVSGSEALQLQFILWTTTGLTGLSSTFPIVSVCWRIVHFLSMACTWVYLFCGPTVLHTFIGLSTPLAVVRPSEDNNSFKVACTYFTLHNTTYLIGFDCSCEANDN